MKNGLFLTALSVGTALLAGCSTPVPAPVPELAPQPEVIPVPALPVLSSMKAEMQLRTDGITHAGGLAALGIDESRSLELALNLAKVNGRKALAQILNDRIEALARAFSGETGIPYDSLLLSGFNNAVKTITKQQIAGRVAQTIQYETTGDSFTAYALMVLDPQIIADQLAKETELYSRLQPTKAFEAFNQEIKAYQAFLAVPHP